jgi:non-heme chloroperoxidase
MPTITTKDGTEIFYNDWGKGQPIVFSHGWPLSADDWDNQMVFFLNHGYRVIAHDRRGHGRSSQTTDGHDMDHYADDLAALTAHLELKEAVHIGHSTGGGEVVRYLARHGESLWQNGDHQRRAVDGEDTGQSGGLRRRVRRILGETPPPTRPILLRPAVWTFTVTTGGCKVSQPVIWNWWRRGMMGGAKARYDGIVAFSQTGFAEGPEDYCSGHGDA